MTVYITKWALTRGILIAEAKDVGDRMVSVRTVRGYNLYFHRGEWHTDLRASVAKAMEMILAKEKSLNRQMAKLTKLATIVPLIVEENLKKL